MKDIVARSLRRFVPRLPWPMIVLAGRDEPRDPKWHQDLILHIASLIRPRTYVELGVYRCGLFNRMLPFARDLVAVDADPAAERFMTRAPHARFFAGTTAQFVDSLRAKPMDIDMLFIDADHSKDAVDHDFAGCLPFVREHGLILLHDTHPQDDSATDPARCGDGYLAIERLSRACERHEMMTLPIHPGLTLCRKRTRQLSWQENATGSPT